MTAALNLTLGIVGKGFIGEAFYEHMKDFFPICVYDVDPKKRNVDSLQELVEKSQVIFISVPTPMDAETGESDVSIVENVVRSIDAICKELIPQSRLIVIRSTCPPGTTRRLSALIDPCIDLVFNPEFLTEANYIQDFKEQNRIVLGFQPHYYSVRLEDIYKAAFPNVPIIQTEWEVAELVKYTANTFLAVKVVFANEIKEIADALQINYDEVIRIATFDARLGKSHWKVPGPDGRRGFGGTCFPKDINALIYRAKQLGIMPNLLQAAWKQNLVLRPERDWEKATGRAVKK